MNDVTPEAMTYARPAGSLRSKSSNESDKGNEKMQQRPIVANCFQGTRIQANSVQRYRLQAGWVRVFVSAAGGFLMVIPLLFILTIGASAADSKHSALSSALAPEVET